MASTTVPPTSKSEKNPESTIAFIVSRAPWPESRSTCLVVFDVASYETATLWSEVTLSNV